MRYYFLPDEIFPQHPAAVLFPTMRHNLLRTWKIQKVMWSFFFSCRIFNLHFLILSWFWQIFQIFSSCLHLKTEPKLTITEGHISWQRFSFRIPILHISTIVAFHTLCRIIYFSSGFTNLEKAKKGKPGQDVVLSGPGASVGSGIAGTLHLKYGM